MIFTASALAVAATFAGAAFYINAVEQPARLGLDDRALLTEWKPAYKRGTLMQAPLAFVGFALGLVAWRLESEPLAAIGAVLIILPWPITFLIIKPTNDRLMATAEPDETTRTLVRNWGRLHALRTLASAAAASLFLIAIAT